MIKAREAEVRVRLARRGLTWRAIGEACGVTKQAASQSVRRWLFPDELEELTSRRKLLRKRGKS